MSEQNIIYCGNTYLLYCILLCRWRFEKVFNCQQIYLLDIVLNLILQNEGFSLVAISIEYICYGISINLCILMILIFRKIFLKPNPIVFEGGFDFVVPVEEVKDEKVFYIGF